MANMLNTRLYRVLEIFTNLFFLNVLWVVACLPVVTAFPATAAMFGVAREWVKGREPGVFGAFYGKFRENFRQALVIGAVWTLIGATLALNYRLVGEMAPLLRAPLLTLIFFFVFAYALASVFLFPVMVNYRASWPDTMRNALLLSVGNLTVTFQCLLVLVVLGLVVFFLPLALIVAGSVAAYAIYRLCNRAFERVDRRRKSTSGGPQEDAAENPERR